MPKKRSCPETAEKISVLVRIYQAAVRSHDEGLRRATAAELAEYGVDAASLAADCMTKGGEQ